MNCAAARLAVIVIAIACAAGLGAQPARADEPDAEARADAAFRTAEERVAHGDPAAIDAFEALGAERPITRWTDDAWLEAARLAERGADRARARRDLDQALAVTTDDAVRRRAQAARARLADAAGAAGEWDAVASEHDRLAAKVRDVHGGDPKPALHALEALVRAHPSYPRAAAAMMVIAAGWERDGDGARALGWLREAQAAPASAEDHERAVGELVRTSIRAGELADARVALAGVHDRVAAAELAGELDRAQTRRVERWTARAVLVLLVAGAVVALRRAAAGWRAAVRRLARPPVELLYYAPIAGVLVAIAWTGNPMVARAVSAIAGAGAVVAWLSGAILEGRRGRLGAGRAAVHAGAAVLAVVAATWLAVDRGRMMDLITETVREGPIAR